MLPDTSIRTFESAELLTVFTIEQSETGLELLAREAHQSAQKLEAGDVAAALGTLQSLIEHLYDFRQFVRDVCAMYSLAPALVGDDHGSLAENADHFRDTLYTLSDALEEHDTTKLVYLLDICLPKVLTRFRELMPALSTHITPNFPDAA